MRAALLALWPPLLAACATAHAATPDTRPTLPDPPGIMVDLGAHRLHLHCVGEGSPTVVFDSGLGGSSLDWSRVQPDVARDTRACAYDRAGYGWSDPVPGPRTSAILSAELGELLRRAGVAPPYVLVGHSFGGFNVRLFASIHPDSTAGLVLIDSSHERQFERFEEAGLPAAAPRSGQIIIDNPSSVPESLPPELRPLAESFTMRAGFVATLRGELGNLRRSAGELRTTASLPDVPLVVISHHVRTDGEPDLKDALWLEMQRDLATRTSHARLVIADTEDHYVQLSEPTLVIAAIRSVVAESRPRGRAASAGEAPRN